MDVNSGHYLLSFIVAAGFGFVVAMDARKRGMNSVLWGLGTCLALIIFLPLYIILRRSHPEGSEEEENELSQNKP